MYSRDYLSKKIKQYRKKNGLTLVEFAENLGVGKSTVSNWEKCENDIDVTNAIKLANLFNVGLDSLFDLESSNMKVQYKMYELSKIKDLHISIKSIKNSGTNDHNYRKSVFELELENQSNKSVDLRDLKFQLKDELNNSVAPMRKIKEIEHWDWDDDCWVEYKKLNSITSNIPTFIDGKDKIKFILEFEGILNLNMNYKFIINIFGQSITYTLEPHLLNADKLFNSSYSQQNYRVKYNSDICEELFKYYSVYDESQLEKLNIAMFNKIIDEVIESYKNNIFNYTDILYLIKSNFNKDEYIKIVDRVRNSNNKVNHLMSADINNIVPNNNTNKFDLKIIENFKSKLTNNLEVLVKIKIDNSGISYNLIKTYYGEKFVEESLKYKSHINATYLLSALKENVKDIEKLIQNVIPELNIDEVVKIFEGFRRHRTHYTENIVEQALIHVRFEGKKDFSKVRKLLTESQIKILLSKGNIPIDYLI